MLSHNVAGSEIKLRNLIAISQLDSPSKKANQVRTPTNKPIKRHGIKNIMI